MGAAMSEPQHAASWAAFLATVQMGGALPVAFRPDGDHVVAEAIVPYVPPEPRTGEGFRLGLALARKIPLAIAAGFPVPVSARVKLPTYSPVDSPREAAQFIRDLVREMYHHEIDEQLFVDGSRPFAPGH
jgi:hypothetical protein